MRESSTSRRRPNNSTGSSSRRKKPAFLIRNTPILEAWFPEASWTKSGSRGDVADFVSITLNATFAFRPIIHSILRLQWNKLTEISQFLTMTEHKITANRPEAGSAAPGRQSEALQTPNGDAATELDRLRAENALLRAQVSSISTGSLLLASPVDLSLSLPRPLNSSGNRLLKVPSSPSLPSSSSVAAVPTVGRRPRPVSDYPYEYDFEDAAPTYEEALAARPEHPPAFNANGQQGSS